MQKEFFCCNLKQETLWETIHFPQNQKIFGKVVKQVQGDEEVANIVTKWLPDLEGKSYKYNGSEVI